MPMIWKSYFLTVGVAMLVAIFAPQLHNVYLSLTGETPQLNSETSTPFASSTQSTLEPVPSEPDASVEPTSPRPPQWMRSFAIRLAQSRFAGSEYLAALIGDSRLRLERYELSTHTLYFSAEDSTDIIERIHTLAVDDDAVTFARTSSGGLTVSDSRPLELDNLVYRGMGRLFFAVSVSDLRITPDTRLSFITNGFDFDPSVQDVLNISERRNWYGGARMFSYNGQRYVNHAGLVVRRDAALARLAERIVFGATSHDERVQRLLDFVTAIPYDEESLFLTRELMQNAYHTIAMNLGDCGNKVILFASLLEQINADFRLVYTGDGESLNHIFVGVAGDFDDLNGLSILDSDSGVRYFGAETTARGFQIGRTLLETQLLGQGRSILVQSASTNARIRDMVRNSIVAYR